MLDRAIYSYADVDRLVGLHEGTSRRWLEGYSRSGKFYDPVLREEPIHVDVVTWGEMVEARLLAEFRSRDVSVQRLRPPSNCCERSSVGTRSRWPDHFSMSRVASWSASFRTKWGSSDPFNSSSYVTGRA